MIAPKVVPIKGVVLNLVDAPQAGGSQVDKSSRRGRHDEPAVDLASLPAPLLAADVNVSTLAWMPMAVQALLADANNRNFSNTIFRARIRLICAAWRETPAGSVSSDPASMLHHCSIDARTLAASMRTLMADWTLCSDGRYYHPAICEAAEKAWQSIKDARDRKRRQRERDEGSGHASRHAQEREKKEDCYPEKELLPRAGDSPSTAASAAKRQKWAQGLLRILKQKLSRERFETLAGAWIADEPWALREMNDWDRRLRAEGGGQLPLID